MMGLPWVLNLPIALLSAICRCVFFTLWLVQINNENNEWMKILGLLICRLLLPCFNVGPFPFAGSDNPILHSDQSACEPHSLRLPTLAAPVQLAWWILKNAGTVIVSRQQKETHLVSIDACVMPLAYFCWGILSPITSSLLFWLTRRIHAAVLGGFHRVTQHRLDAFVRNGIAFSPPPAGHL